MNSFPELLNAAQRGDPKAAEELLPLVYDELRRLAVLKMSQEQPGHTLQPTALVHEAWLRLVGSANQEFDGRGHFISAAAEAMRRILIEKARQKMTLKRGNRAERVDLESLEVANEADDETLLVMNDALERLSQEDRSSAEFIKLRFFAGLNTEEAALTLGIPERTARRHWSFARAWLFREIQRQRSG